MNPDIIIIGAGAAGLMCAIEAGKRGRRVLVLDHSARIAEKIRISGGGRCNFTNINSSPAHFISNNEHFCRSALKRFTQHDFIQMVHDYQIPFHEKTLGQLFCDKSATDIINMLRAECDKNHVEIRAGIKVGAVKKQDHGFSAETAEGKFECESLVIATGGPSIPKMGSSTFGYEVAQQFGLNMIQPRAGLVPLVFDPVILNYTKELSGVSLDPVEVKSQSGKKFREAMLFTHRGISGPAILQISSYWNPGEDITINHVPDLDLPSWLKEKRKTHAKTALQNVLSDIIPKRLAQMIMEELQISEKTADLSDKKIAELTTRLQSWRVKPSGSEGYRTAEVTLGGVDTDELSSKTFEAHKVKGLYFIGEVIDVTGHLGGFNFQWAWSSGWCAGQYA